jgi:hypothetical protein
LQATLLHNLADCYILTGRPIRAAVLLRKAIGLLEEAGEAGAVETCHGHVLLGGTLEAAGRVQESLEHYRAARDSFGELEMPTVVSVRKSLDRQRADAVAPGDRGGARNCRSAAASRGRAKQSCRDGSPLPCCASQLGAAELSNERFENF